MDITKLVRNNILQLKPYTSARDSFSDGVLMDANENSFGSSWVFESIDLNRYPDPASNELRESLADYLGIDKNNLFAGVGSDEIIDLLIRIFCGPSADNVIICEPTYGMYKVACDLNDIKVKRVSLDKEFQLDTQSIISSVDGKTKIIFLCSPNNPTGNLLNKEDVLDLCRTTERIVIVDEAYIEFAEISSLISEVSRHPNLILLRTFSKAWGLAGLRCGYCIADNSVIEFLMKIKAPYHLNKITQYGITEAINNRNRKDRFVESIISERDRLFKELNNIDAIETVYPSDANYILFKLPDASSIYNKLASQGIIIRDRSSQHGLDNCLRVSIGTEKENNLFINELRRILCAE